MSKAVDISNSVVKEFRLSDHFCVFFEMSVSPDTLAQSACVKKRCINEQTAHLFMEVMSTSVCFLIILNVKHLKLLMLLYIKR